MSHARNLPSLAATLCIAIPSLFLGVNGAGVIRAQTPAVPAPAAQDLAIGTTATGSLADPAASQAYRFTLSAVERIAVTIDPPPDGAVAVNIHDTAGQPLAVVASPPAGAPWAWVGQLPPGTYEVDARAATASQGDYRLRVERLDPFAVSQDQEPNDTRDRARPLPPSLEISGTRDADGDVDWYSLGSLVVPTTMSLATSGAPGTVRVSDGTADYPAVADATGLRLRTVMLPAGVPLYLRAEPEGAYDIRIDSGAPSVSGPPIPAPLFEVEMGLTTERTTVAAGLDAPQRLPATLGIQNEEPEGEQLPLDALTSDEAWAISIEQPQVDLAGNGIVTVPATIEVPPFARADVPIRITIRARDAHGAQATGFVDITPLRDAPPVTP